MTLEGLPVRYAQRQPAGPASAAASIGFFCCSCTLLLALFQRSCCTGSRCRLAGAVVGSSNNGRGRGIWSWGASHDWACLWESALLAATPLVATVC